MRRETWPISCSSDYTDWLLMCHLHGWSLHCFSHTCWDKERARSSAEPSVLRNDSKSNWLHATLSRQSRTRAAAEEQVRWMTEPSVCLSSTFHANGLRRVRNPTKKKKVRIGSPDITFFWYLPQKVFNLVSLFMTHVCSHLCSIEQLRSRQSWVSLPKRHHVCINQLLSPSFLYLSKYDPD